MIASLLFTRQLTTNTLLKLGAELIGPALSVLLVESGLLLGCLWVLRRPVSQGKTGMETAV